jgi:YHS domain-containing protein
VISQEEPKKETEEIQTQEKLDTGLPTAETEELIVQEIWNKVCPVKGNPIEDDTPTVEYDGKLYGFCCPGCDTKFAKNPKKYSKNLSEDGTKFVGRK